MKLFKLALLFPFVAPLLVSCNSPIESGVSLTEEENPSLTSAPVVEVIQKIELDDPSNLTFFSGHEAEQFKSAKGIEFYNGFSFGEEVNTKTWVNPTTNEFMFEVDFKETQSVKYYYFQNEAGYKLVTTLVNSPSSSDQSLLLLTDESKTLLLAKVDSAEKPSLDFTSLGLRISSSDELKHTGGMRSSSGSLISYFLFGDKDNNYKLFSFDADNEVGVRVLGQIEPKAGYEYKWFKPVNKTHYYVEFMKEGDNDQTYVTYRKFPNS